MNVVLLKETENAKIQYVVRLPLTINYKEITNLCKKFAIITQLIIKFVFAKRYSDSNSKIFPWHRENYSPDPFGAFFVPSGTGMLQRRLHSSKTMMSSICCL